jgi:hypothetical protein
VSALRQDGRRQQGCIACLFVAPAVTTLLAENAKNGLPPGLTVESAGAGGGGSGAAGGGGASADPLASASASSGLLGTLRCAAAAAQAAAERHQQGGRAWWQRLLPGRGAAGGDGGTADASGAAAGSRLSSEAQAARGRLSRVIGTPGGGTRGAAGYGALPDSAASVSPSMSSPGWRQLRGGGGGATWALPTGGVGTGGVGRGQQHQSTASGDHLLFGSIGPHSQSPPLG